jgi:hypothetical protein
MQYSTILILVRNSKRIYIFLISGTELALENIADIIIEPIENPHQRNNSPMG